mgnify:CR=1 FL=1
MSENQKKYDVVGLGSCTMDCIFKVDDVMRMDLIDRDKNEKKYIGIEHSSKLNVNEVKFYPGGSAANIAVDLSNIGMKTAYIGGIGTDSSGDSALKDLKTHGVDVSGIKRFEEEVTATSVILITPWGRDRSILAYKGANNLFGPKHINEEMLKSTKCFAWTSLTSDNGIAAIRKCIELARASGALIAGAPSISIIKKRPEDAKQILKQCDVTSMNDEEIEALTGTKDAISGMRTLFDWGLQIVNVTFGKEGQWISDGKILVRTKPPKVFPADTTGAGDATMSGIIYGKLQGKSLAESARIASSLSAMEIEAPGVRVGTPQEWKQLNNFMQRHTIEQETVGLDGQK